MADRSKLSNKGCRLDYIGGRLCMCPGGRCWYREQRERAGEPETPKEWRERLSREGMCVVPLADAVAVVKESVARVFIEAKELDRLYAIEAEAKEILRIAELGHAWPYDRLKRVLDTQ